MRYLTIVLFLISSLFAHSQKIKFGEWENLTKSGKLPPQCKLMHSNNNLDLVKYKGKYYLAFRTAPTHYASKKVKMYVVSSYDLNSWEYETEIALERDVREPKFAVYHDTLNLYFFTGGQSIFSFEPHQLLMCRTIGSHYWNQPISTNLDGFVPWRLRQRNDTLYMSAYDGRNLYNTKHTSNLRLFYTTSATSFQQLTVAPQIDADHAEEGEFIFDKKGDLFATVRLESSGALICNADHTNIGSWRKVKTKNKYDSALLFDHNDDLYLVSRRNKDGEMNRYSDSVLTKRQQIHNMVRYWFTRKVTSVFKLNKQDLSLSLMADLPSTGDNAFPGIVKIDDNNYVLMNYSSNIKGRKKIWFTGQLGRTYIYMSKMSFEPDALGLK